MILLTRSPHQTLRTRTRRRLASAAATLTRGSCGLAPPGGPEAVVRSLARGLAGLSLPFELNPRRLDSAGTVGVLSDLEALEHAIAWRQRVRAGRLVVGPNLVVLPTDAPSLMEAPEIDLCLVPSEWVKRLYENDAPTLKGKIAIWPAGVDPEAFKPAVSRNASQRRALVYLKRQAGQRNASDSEVTAAQQALDGAGFAVDTLTYGSFTNEQYREALQRTEVMLFFSPTESQCLAVAEAWSADVPTLVWSCGQLEYRGRTYSGSSAPYLSAQTGLEFEDVRVLGHLLDRWDELRPALAPRQWVLQHMTDTLSARAYWALAHPKAG